LFLLDKRSLLILGRNDSLDNLNRESRLLLLWSHHHLDNDGGLLTSSSSSSSDLGELSLLHVALSKGSRVAGGAASEGARDDANDDGGDDGGVADVVEAGGLELSVMEDHVTLDREHGDGLVALVDLNGGDDLVLLVEGGGAAGLGGLDVE